MAPVMNQAVVIIDDEDIVMIENEGDFLEILDPGGSFPPREAHQITRIKSNTHQLAAMKYSRVHGKSPVRSGWQAIQSSFRSLDWRPKSTLGDARDRASPTISCTGSRYSKSFTLSPSPTSFPNMISYNSGTAKAPIILDEDDSAPLAGRRSKSKDATEVEYSKMSGIYSLMPRQGTPSLQDAILLSATEEDTANKFDPDEKSVFTCSPRCHPAEDDELIDLDDIEDDLQDSVETLAIQGTEDSTAAEFLRSSKSIPLPHRNPTIVSPLRICKGYQFKGKILAPNKTIELHEGGFIRISDIILNECTGEVRIRGHQLQRTRNLNGLLEKKINEVVLFMEVDLDDKRHPSVQAAVEVSINDVARLRRTRLTNQKFPLCRLVDLTEKQNKARLEIDGGLTLRWKYTCTYATAADRYRNEFKERTLERLRASECHFAYRVSDADRRLQWRGETVLGGAYRPEIDPEQEPYLPEHTPASPLIVETTPRPNGIIPLSKVPEGISTSDTLTLQYSRTSERDIIRLEQKRKHNSLEIPPSDKNIDANHIPKRVCQEGEKQVEDTRQHLSSIILHNDKKRHSRAPSITIYSSPPTPHSQHASPPKQTELSSRSAPILPAHSFLQIIDLSSSELSTPPPTGTLHSTTAPSHPTLTIKTLSQTFTYGDAFCGAGGATRGAFMAGLHIKWGFDFNANACSSWSANFPSAKNYNLPADEFIHLARQAASNGHPDIMKVDILHLSPPCQYFSPAHTVNGVDDEMNVASLFAVEGVIEVSKPRVVTLEQTFGIAGTRFRFYFNSLIQMFTMHDFSVRWSVIPLAQWGLPQRRNRLIIIASCPGEVLPRMPPPTHCDPNTPSPSLPPYVSVSCALSSIPSSSSSVPDPLHDINAVTFPASRTLPPWDASKILPRAMTTSGGQNYHPSGTRDLTLREYATLQGFPMEHVFNGSGAKKQIGNAVPPCVAKVLYEGIKRELESVDGVQDGWVCLD